MMEASSSSAAFLGVRFILFGFNPQDEHQVRSKLINGGGVDAGHYNQNCSHVIVDNIVYDDPVCVAARNDGRTLVTSLWVDHSIDIGMPVDATSVMYRPLKDLNGIPGSKSLIVCLTGYQRQDRDDIMTMVGLMGAQFSKPLVASKVTHLICYKFEGEKYDLAKRMKKIKLVNHRWLEDCLKEWKLLPEDKYTKSGYELEMMEAEAKDSDDDVEDDTTKQSSHGHSSNSPGTLRKGTPTAPKLFKSAGELPKTSCNLSEPGSNRMNITDSATGNDGVYASEVLGCHMASSSKSPTSIELPIPEERTPTSIELPNPEARTPNSLKVDHGLNSVSRSAEIPLISDAKFNDISYARKPPRISPSSLLLRGSHNANGFPKTPLSVGKNSSSANSGHTGSGNAQIAQEESGLAQEDASTAKKQKIDASCFSTRSPEKTSHNAPSCIMQTPSVSDINKKLGPTSSPDGQPKINDNSPTGNHGQFMQVKASPIAARDSCSDVTKEKSSEVKKTSAVQELTSCENMILQGENLGNNSKKTPQTPVGELRAPNLISKTDGASSSKENSDHLISEAGCPHNKQQDDRLLAPFNEKSEIEKSHEEKEGCFTKPVKKTIVKKTLGSRPNSKTVANRKGSIYSNKATIQSNQANTVSGGEGNKKHEKLLNTNELDVSIATANYATVDVDAKGARNFEDDGVDKGLSAGDETKAPEETDDHGNAYNNQTFDVVGMHKQDSEKEMKSQGAQQLTKNSMACMNDDSKEGENVVEKQNKDESPSQQNGTKGKTSERKKQPAGRTKTKAVPADVQISESKRFLAREENLSGKNVNGKGVEREICKPCPLGNAQSRKASRKRSKSPTEAEKENKLLIDGDSNNSRAKAITGKTAVQSDKTEKKVSGQTGKGKSSSKPIGEVSKVVKAEPARFILSGHRLQRKEFQQMIRRLKGKFCRDSHQWSYQATHFIAPDPIRRTEKFFAAAASGRWILKSNYVSASSEAGRFLLEEPYEWHRNGLSEDGAINLEAPMKWRLLRERTGHGAFHGMRIIIYGECIAPPLDTLKRVVKAGDGTILATSPPYTRFLTSGVDYAVVSPGMPRVDLWIQEFVKHEIPCVVADYLVEYVCKPGYSLDKHVLYSTHKWAEKSFSKLMSKAEEVVEEDSTETPPENGGNKEDIACEVCGCHDRGEAMLICGDESGSFGCGVGMHIDCCDPPLEDIPEEDWFCPKCSRDKHKHSAIPPPKKRKKGKSSSKTK